MALTHTQNYKDNRKEDVIFGSAEALVSEKNRLVNLKTRLLATTAEIAADANASAELKTLGIQASGFINNAKITDFISFITSNLG